MLSFIIWALITITTLVVLAYRSIELRTSTISLGILLIAYMLIGDPGGIYLVLLWILFGLLVSVNIPEIRRNYFSARILKLYKAVLPNISKTEQEAIDAGNVWWDAELFTGNPNWEVLRSNPKPKLSEKEQSFIDGPVNKVCEMIDEWQVIHKDYDLPEEVYDFIKKEGFLSLIIPEEYGGLEFSPLGVASVMSKIGSRSPTLSSMVGVPNSLGNSVRRQLLTPWNI